MKILDITIKDVRGIRQEINLKPEGKNVVIFGPNGTGKSAVVDAIDFLFTGDISRLAGRGSMGMSLKKHGKHIDADIKDAFVKATIELDGDKILIERHMAKPKELIYPEKDKDKLNEILSIAQKGQHVLSRSEILKFIAAESGKRSEEIQALLNLKKIEEIRKAFVTIKSDADKSKRSDESTLERSKASVNTVIGLKKFSIDEILKNVNELRKTLKGKLITELKVEKLKEGIDPRTTDKDKKIYPEHFKNTLSETNKIIKEKGNEIFESEKQLRITVKTLKENDQLKKDLSNKKLIDMGISLVDETGSCPLCLTKFETGKLNEFLKKRLSTAEEASKIEKQINDQASNIDKQVTVLKGHIDTLTDMSKKLEKEDIEKDLKIWSEALGSWSEALREATDDYPIDEPPEEIKALLKIPEWDKHDKRLAKFAEGLEKSTPEQKAWDGLTALERDLKRYFDDEKRFKSSSEFADTAKILSETYSETKDQVLENLFKTVNGDFTDYYKFLHGDDENGFESELKPDGASLDFNVDFYKRGKHHPRALHSEGHQDSMGLCLYLALYKKISEGKVKCVILDDVVMSIDASHRKNICKLLKKYFDDIQFIITTHNRTWARQLRTDGVVTGKNMYEFMGWSVDTGPRYQENMRVWDEIKKKVENNQITPAAAQLREHLEFFFEGICDSLRAPVPYRTDSRYELGYFMSGAKGKFKSLLKQAKASANSWGNREIVGTLSEIETQYREDVERTKIDQWIINENVHFDKLSDSSKDDFLPIVEAFQDFERFYICSACGGKIMINMRNMTETSVKCPCGKINWNLEMKK